MTRRVWALISQEAQITLNASKLGKIVPKNIVCVGAEVPGGCDRLNRMNRLNPMVG